MAATKSSKKAPTVTVAKATATLMAVSTNEAVVDSKESAILHCLSECFFNNGFPALSPSAKIVWSTIPNNIITGIGDCVRDCLTGKGFQSISWAAPFLNLKSQGKVTVVSSLVTAMANVVQP
jgi:hypothetical protein